MFGLAGRESYLPLPRVRSRAPLAISGEWDRLIVLANRAPCRHEHGPGGRIAQTRTASGVVTALEPLVAACSGIWVAHSAGGADNLVVDERCGLNVPPANPRYRLRYVSLDADEHRGFYYGFANEALWPLCHSVHVPAVFRSDDFRHYESATTRFVNAVASESNGGSPLVFVQDYHFALAPRRLRKALPSSTVVGFWHIPWPHVRMFRTCPWHRELLDGMLGSDVIGFQTPEDANNFIECVHTLLRADTDGRRTITYRGRPTRVGAYPVGAEWDNPVIRALPGARVCRSEILRDFDLPDHAWLGVGVDRLDYTKGLHEKFLAIERALELCPPLRGRFTFIQVAEPSRNCLPHYREARARLHEATARINGRFGTTGYTPIRLLEAHHEAEEVYRLYRAADVCHVGSLHDGMNLVAKEFVCARDDERGVLLLSEFTGSARQLRTAVLVNPYAVDATAGALARACTMSPAEQAMRMRLMRANVRAFDATWWATRLLEDASTALMHRRAQCDQRAEERIQVALAGQREARERSLAPAYTNAE